MEGTRIILNHFQGLVSKLQETNSRIEKEQILRDYDTEENRRILWFIFNPYIVTGVSDKKAAKYKSRSVETVNYCKCETLEELLTYFTEHNTGRDEDLILLKNFTDHFPEFKNLIYSIITKSIRIGVTSVTLNKIYGEGFIPQFDVMLAQKYFDNPEKLVPEGTEMILTTKLDGVRCILINEASGAKLYSRQGQLFEGMVEIEEEAKSLPCGWVFDGELLLDIDNLESKDLYRETMKVISADGEKTNVIFNMFDMLPEDDFQKGFCDQQCRARKQMVNYYLSQYNLPHIREVKQLYVGKDKSQITYWLDKITSEGGEGVMINIADAPYECKRTKNLLKVKKFQTCDVLVTNLIEGQGNFKGMLGAVSIQFIGPDSVQYSCEVGSGFSLEERKDFWEHPENILNKIVEIGYFEISSNQNGTYSLRFPIFKHLRPEKTEISMY